MYEDDGFRENVSGHICNRDSLLFLWEALIVSSTEEESKSAAGKSGVTFQEETKDAAVFSPKSSSRSKTSRRKSFENETSKSIVLPSIMRNSLVIARACSSVEKIEITETTCHNGHAVGISNLSTDIRFSNKNLPKCISCKR